MSPRGDVSPAFENHWYTAMVTCGGNIHRRKFSSINDVEDHDEYSGIYLMINDKRMWESATCLRVVFTYKIKTTAPFKKNSGYTPGSRRTLKRKNGEPQWEKDLRSFFLKKHTYEFLFVYLPPSAVPVHKRHPSPRRSQRLKSKTNFQNRIAQRFHDKLRSPANPLIIKLSN